MIKKVLCLGIIGAMVFGLVACGTSGNSEAVAEATTQVQAINENVYDIPEEEIIAQTGIDLIAPEGAEDVKYNLIDPNGEAPIAEMEFTLNGKKAYVRAQSTDLLPLEGTVTEEDIEARNITGLYYEWTSGGQVQLGTSDAFADEYLNEEEKVGYVSWIDTDNGVLYNVAMDEAAEESVLDDITQKVFTALQSEE